MKLQLFFILHLISLLLLFSCSDKTSNDKNKNTNVQNKTEKTNKSELKLDPEKDFIEIISKGKTPDSELFIKKAIKDSAFIAAKAALDGVLLHFNESEIEDDLLVFGLESDLNKNLSLELISENAVVYVAENKIDIPSKLVFKAIKLNKLKAGMYYFILRDELGIELIKKIKISHRK